MKHQLCYFYCVIACFICCGSFGQQIDLFQQFNGRFDFTIIGNTMNLHENGTGFPCEIKTESTANLNLADGNTLEKAYLYWAGSGPGDLEVNLNGEVIVPDLVFHVTQNVTNLVFFSAFKEVTSQVSETGNGDYTLSNLDVSAFLPTYCPNATNFAGWAIIAIYKNENLPLNQLNLYSGLDYVSRDHTMLTFDLNSLNVIDDVGAKIGFLAWEGDRSIAEGEKLFLNNVELSSPINPATNAFNGTNSIIGSTTLYNMDIDVYDIEDIITIGQTSAEIRLTSDRDFVMVNAVVTKLNSQLPDATILAENLRQECNSRLIIVDFTVSNLNSTDILDAAVPISIYANDTLINFAETLGPIPIGGSQSSSIALTIPDEIPNDFILTFIVDRNGLGSGNVTETNENNNVFSMPVSLKVSPLINAIPNLQACNLGFGKGSFDFSENEELVKTDAAHVVTFHENFEDAQNDQNPIIDTSGFLSESPKEIFVRVEDDFCFATTSFQLITKKCPPTIYNLVEPSGNNFYDSLKIEGLRNIFENFQLSIFNRWGKLVWTGNNATEDWRGEANKGSQIIGNLLPEGTYFYILELHDEDYPNPMNGYIYLKR